ncbi:MAG TPA: IclR family transcriptional regulator [Acidimicrobiales bacterium]|jgi:DNA-binding IclR family transcriptional regulator
MGDSVADEAGPVDRAGVVDKVAAILDALESGPAPLTSLVAATGLPRATAHRLAVALGRHGLVGRDDEGRFVLGLRLIGLGRAAAGALPLRALARPALEALRHETGESVQLYVTEDDAAGGPGRRCVLSLQSPHGLRWIVPEGALLPLDRGSAGRVLRGGSPGGRSPGESPANRRGSETGVESGWVESVEEREPGVASVSAGVRGPDGALIAAVSVSGPIERLSRHPGARFGAAVLAAAAAIELEARTID